MALYMEVPIEVDGHRLVVEAEKETGDVWIAHLVSSGRRRELKIPADRQRALQEEVDWAIGRTV